MIPTSILVVARGLLASILVCTVAGAACAAYPDRPIRLVVPFPPGGAVDVVARIIAAKAAEALGGTILVESRAGAGGVIATEQTARAAPDGYTLLFTTPSHTINPALYAKLSFDTEKDLVPIALVAAIPELFVSNSKEPFDSFAGFVDYARSHPGKLNYASAGNGTLPHVTTELLLRRLGLDVVHVPYKGAAPALTDVLAGNVAVKMDTITTSAPHIAAGELKALALASTQRSPIMPDVPTVAESGLPGYEGVLWMGVVAPVGTPREVIAKLQQVLLDAARAPEVRERLRSLGVDDERLDGQAFGALISREIKQWRDLVRESKITADGN
jgi:tripartite-type tricarboxylate transporter receptor subunit TctC